MWTQGHILGSSPSPASHVAVVLTPAPCRLRASVSSCVNWASASPNTYAILGDWQLGETSFIALYREGTVGRNRKFKSHTEGEESKQKHLEKDVLKPRSAFLEGY